MPLVALSLTALMGCTALAVDAGYLRYEQRVQQSATDSAALAGAEQLPYGAGSIATAAQGDATRNGYTAGTSNTTITVTNPPANGPYSGDANAVDVVITRKRPTFFSGIAGISNGTVTTEAVGLLRPATGPKCIYVLSPSSTTRMNGAQISMPTCGLIMNNAMTSNGGTIDASTIGVNGNITTHSTSFPESSPAPALQVPDPCMSIPGCAYLRNNTPPGTACNYHNFSTSGNGSGVLELQPGVYCGSTTLSSGTVQFNSGLYVFTGNVTTNGVQDMEGSGVTIVMEGNASSLTLNGSTMNLTAPTSGDTAGMLVYAPSVSRATFNGHAGDMSGILYFPQSDMTFNGASSAYYVLVTDTLTLNGAATDGGPGSGGPYVDEAVLAQ